MPGKEVDSFAFLAGGGAMGERIRELDWTATAVGPIEDWPPSLRIAVSLVLNSEIPMHLAWGPELVTFHNDAYQPLLGEKPEALGRPFSEVWGEAWDLVGPIARRAFSGEGSCFTELPITLERHGYREEAWWTLSCSPVRDESGRVGGVLCVVQETTGEVLARSQLAGERTHLRDLLRQSPSLMVVLRGEDHEFELVNEAYERLFAGRELIGKPVREALPELAEQGFVQLLDQVYRSGEPFVGAGVAMRLRRTREGRMERRVFDFVYQPIRDADGRVTGIFGNGVDVTERHEGEERQMLLLNELNHRVRNTLATVQSMARQTARQSGSLPEFVETYEGRLLALSHAHAALTNNRWEGARLRTLVEQEFRAYAGEHYRVSGPDVALRPGQVLALGLVIHELATNAAKYGAFSAPNGCVRVSWNIEGRIDAQTVVLAWAESGGPQVSRPSKAGFGSRLIQTLVERDLGGSIVKDFAADGLRCRIVFGLSEQTRAALAPAQA